MDFAIDSFVCVIFTKKFDTKNYADNLRLGLKE